MSEADVARKLKQKNISILWKPTPDRFGTGIPDRACKFRHSGTMFWSELKFLKCLPKTRCKIGLKKAQASWLAEWQNDGGNCCLIIGVASENKVALVFDDYKRIAAEGMLRGEFSLVGYSEVENILKTRFKMV